MLRSQTSIQPDFDWQQLRQLAGEDTDFETELLTLFLTDTGSSLRQLEQAIAHQDFSAVQDIAHALRGASANVGASALAQVASKLETLASSRGQAMGLTTGHTTTGHTITGRMTNSASSQTNSPSALLEKLRQHYLAIQSNLQSRR